MRRQPHPPATARGDGVGLADVDGRTLRCRAGIGDLAGAVDGTGGGHGGPAVAVPALPVSRKAIGGGGGTWDGVGWAGRFGSGSAVGMARAVDDDDATPSYMGVSSSARRRWPMTRVSAIDYGAREPPRAAQEPGREDSWGLSLSARRAKTRTPGTAPGPRWRHKNCRGTFQSRQMLLL